MEPDHYQSHLMCVLNCMHTFIAFYNFSVRIIFFRIFSFVYKFDIFTCKLIFRYWSVCECVYVCVCMWSKDLVRKGARY